MNLFPACHTRLAKGCAGAACGLRRCWLYAVRPLIIAGDRLLIKAVIVMARDIATAWTAQACFRTRRRRWRKWRSDNSKDGVS